MSGQDPKFVKGAFAKMSDDVIVDKILPIFGGSAGFADFLPINLKNRFAPRSAA